MAESLSLRTTAEKTLRINLDLQRYGAFAEIGAGQEVARHFFQAGKASQTIAKSMSAYDMTYSDEIYGREKNGRYVCESRLNQMLEKEYSLLNKRLGAKRGDHTAFFAYANTVATGTESSRCHGWMGVRFQARPGGPSNDVVLHVRMLDRHRLQQQQALGILGVNLTEAAFYGLAEPEKFITYLTENLKPGQVAIDVLKFSGPDLGGFENRRMNMELIRRGLAEAILFSPEGHILNIPDAVWGRSLLIQRGTFRPLTRTHVDVMEKGVAQLISTSESKAVPLPLMEMVMHRGTAEGEIQDFEDRIDVINAAGYHALVSNFELYYLLRRFFRAMNDQPLALIMGASRLSKLFDENRYSDLEGGALEGLGKLLDERTRIMVYPHKTQDQCLTARLYHPGGPINGIYDYFRQLQRIVDISGCDEAAIYWHSEDVYRLIVEKKNWEDYVPPKAADYIRRRHLWNV